MIVGGIQGWSQNREVEEIVTTKDTILTSKNIPEQYKTMADPNTKEKENSEISPAVALNTSYAVGTIDGEANISPTGGALIRSRLTFLKELPVSNLMYLSRIIANLEWAY